MFEVLSDSIDRHQPCDDQTTASHHHTGPKSPLRRKNEQLVYEPSIRTYHALLARYMIITFFRWFAGNFEWQSRWWDHTPQFGSSDVGQCAWWVWANRLKNPNTRKIELALSIAEFVRSSALLILMILWILIAPKRKSWYTIWCQCTLFFLLI